MLRSDYDGQTCSIARTLEVVGERWTMLVLRNVFLGLRRFDEIQRNLGIARNVLADRLGTLVEHGVLEKVPYQERPVRHEYRLTEKGVDLWPVIVSLMQWGDRHAPTPAGPPVLLRHRDCGGAVSRHLTCEACGAALGPRDVRSLPGPGAPPDHPLLVARGAADGG
ncbi:helix-turn-helix domain-containing protein [Conexibacter sp. W3-3-2]|uniref:winged helix-turn-helix transcriptional regulator n=1 Tax=Conexibacter sp. W3-3-2 TaxID=2675227 RepID=UPI00281579E6|nr:helix-turn-helix domain-containing protein [Conexibacter sp. W3-3-2]